MSPEAETVYAGVAVRLAEAAALRALAAAVGVAGHLVADEPIPGTYLIIGALIVVFLLLMVWMQLTLAPTH